MNRIQQIRKQDEVGRRSRWWRDGLVCAAVGAFAGLVLTITIGAQTFWMVPIAGVTAGVLGACFGERTLAMFHC